MELQARHAIAEVDQGCAGISLHNAMRSPEIRDPRHPWALWDLAIGAADGVKAFAAVVPVPGGDAAGNGLLYHGADRHTQVGHPLQREGNTRGVPELERPHLPVESGAHGAIDIGHTVGDFG